MDIITILLCVMPVLLVAAPFVIGIITSILSAWVKAEETRRKNALIEARLNEAHQKAIEREEARAARALIAEAKAAEANDRATIQMLNVEIAQLKIKKLRKDLNLDAAPFDPDDHG